MKKFFVIGFICTITIYSFAQRDSIIQSYKSKRDWKDTTYKLILLKKISGQRMVKYQYNPNVTFLVGLDDIRERLVKDTSLREEYKKDLKILDRKAKTKADTIRLIPVGYDFDYLIEELLFAAQINVYNNKNRCYADTVMQRFERYGGEGDRFFYFTNRHPFFFVTEISGILDYTIFNTDSTTIKKHYQQYYKEAQKIQSIGQ